METLVEVMQVGLLGMVLDMEGHRLLQTARIMEPLVELVQVGLWGQVLDMQTD